MCRGEGGGGGQRPEKKVCVSKIDLQFRALLMNFIFFSRGTVSDVGGVGGWLRRRSPGCHSALPPPAPSNAKPWPGRVPAGCDAVQLCNSFPFRSLPHRVAFVDMDVWP